MLTLTLITLLPELGKVSRKQIVELTALRYAPVPSPICAVASSVASLI